MIWNVYIEDINARKIKTFNVFNSFSFNKEVEWLFRQDWTCDFAGFKRELRRSAQYCFWSKSEYEVVVTSWPPYIDEKECSRLKEESACKNYNVNLRIGEVVDVFDQLCLNWDTFAKYVYECYCNHVKEEDEEDVTFQEE